MSVAVSCEFEWTFLTLVANFLKRQSCKKAEKWRNPGKWVLIWECSERALQWISTWQGLDVFQKSLCSWALDSSSLSIRRVNCLTRVMWNLFSKNFNILFNCFLFHFLSLLLIIIISFYFISFYLLSPEPEFDFVKKLEDADVIEGGKIELICEVNDEEAPVTWYKGDDVSKTYFSFKFSFADFIDLRTIFYVPQ